MRARQESEGRPAPNPELCQTSLESRTVRIDHETPLQEADCLGLEVEGQVDAGEIEIELRVVELLADRAPCELHGPRELLPNPCKRNGIGRAIACVLRIAEICAAQVLERIRAVSRLDKRLTPLVVFLGS